MKNEHSLSKQPKKYSIINSGDIFCPNTHLSPRGSECIFPLRSYAYAPGWAKRSFPLNLLEGTAQLEAEHKSRQQHAEVKGGGTQIEGFWFTDSKSSTERQTASNGRKGDRRLGKQPSRWKDILTYLEWKPAFGAITGRPAFKFLLSVAIKAKWKNWGN